MKHKKLKILVAEDDSISLKFISKILKIFGENLLIARNGFEAVNHVKKESRYRYHSNGHSKQMNDMNVLKKNKRV
jgi:CheY-like chemotaxis protein